ncbi:MAG: hypothetical protein K0R65_2277 [Crocinitomicaceae bacterium]|jgi:ELWxxDGT repeat protein|nr:hypothetical protein [Crocinitomicaceae bacterium]
MKKTLLLLLSSLSFTTFTQTASQVKTFSGLNSVDYLINYNNKLYFAANDGQNGMELWTSDGTTQGTTLLKDIVSGSTSSSPEQLKVCGDKFYFIAKDPQNTSRKALFVSNGTSAGTIKLITLSANTAGIAASNYFQYYSGNAKVFFKHDDGTGFELWSTDGTVAGTALVRSIFPGAGSSNPDHFFEFVGKLFFNAEDDLNGKELWSTDGTSGGTMLVNPGNVNSTQFGPRYFTEYEGRFYYEYDGELWRSNGGNAALFVQINPDFKSEPKNFLVYGDKLYFAAKRNGLAHELFVTDGTQAGTVPVLSGMNGYYTSSLTPAFGKIFFSGNSDLEGQELWSSDGTPDNTNLYYNLAGDNPNVSSGLIVDNTMLVVNDTLYVSGSQTSNVQELFYTTGADNTLTNIDFAGASSQDADPSDFVNLNNQLYFIAKYTANQGLYKVGSSQQAGLGQAQKESIQVYPNPVSTTLNIHSPNKPSAVDVQSVDGRSAVIQWDAEQKSIDMEKLAPGSYTVHITFDDNTNFTYKVIKL